jgi:hypothetical protein
MDDVIRIQKTLLGDDHVEVAKTYLTISTLFEQQKDIEAALKSARAAQRIFKVKLPASDPQLATVQARITALAPPKEIKPSYSLHQQPPQ